VVTEEYLGPAGRRFINRQIIFHLEKQPIEVVPEDLPELVEWMRVTIALLTEDRNTVKEFSQRILALVDTDYATSNNH
jgi:hypothetical protein